MKATLKPARKERDSNLELLRIIAMLLVLLVHANFLSLGAPSAGEIFYSPVSSFFRFFVEALAIICVNVFILITGWFGIRPKVSRFCALIFQVFFYWRIHIHFLAYSWKSGTMGSVRLDNTIGNA